MDEMELEQTMRFDPQPVQEEATPDLEQTRQFDPVETDEFSLEDIIKEFSDIAQEETLVEEEALQQPEEEPEQLREDIPHDEEDEDMKVAQMDGATRILPDVSAVAPEQEQVTSDTIRLDVIDQADLQMSMVHNAQPVDDEKDAQEPVDPYTESWEPEYDQPMGEYVPPQPIIFQPRSRTRELKKQLVAGPERVYYQMMEKGIGKLQIAIFFCLIVTLLSGVTSVLHALDKVPESRVKLMIFGQLLAMMFAALFGSHQLVEGFADMVRKRFSMNSLLVFTFLACCADGVLCLLATKNVPCCAAFSLTMTMSLWGEYHKRYTKLGQLDTLRKASRLDGIGVTEEYYEGERGLLRFEGQVSDFMSNYEQSGAPEKRLNLYCLIALAVSVAIGIAAGVLAYLDSGIVTEAVFSAVQVLAVSLLAALPASALISVTRPFALLERRLHQVGTVVCGWKGVKDLCGKAVFPLTYADLFPAGTVKLNGVKFYGNRMPDQIVAYGTAVVEANGGGLSSLFTQLLASRNGRHYQVQQLRAYENGGIGGEVEGEAVLVGSVSFLKEMGVEIPEGIRVSQAVCVAVDGELCALLAITYDRDRSSGAGLTTLCSYRGLKPVLLATDFDLTDSFLKNKFAINPKRIVRPDRQACEQLLQVRQDEESSAAVLVTREGLAPFAYGVTGARALRTASNVGVIIHLLGGALGMAIVLTLAILGRLELLTPANMFLYHLVWLIPGLLTTEWTRSI